jgi:putative toxin-antitoxin system antitoxin component (TIGR02293 family)
MEKKQSDVSQASLGLQLGETTHVIKTLKKGLPISAFEKLCRIMDVPDATLAQLVNVSPRTLVRRKKEGRLQPDESERVWRIGNLFDAGVRVLGDEGMARRWFKTPNSALEDKAPIEYADTEPGAREIEDLLGRLEHGVFS